MRKRAIALSVPLLILTAVLCAAIGSVQIPPGEILASLIARISGGQETLPSSHALILYTIRWPRVLLAMVTGAGLSMAGMTLQGLFRNPLADPYIIGISSGAAFGAAVALATGIGARLFGSLAVTLFAFGGSMLALFFVTGLSRKGKKLRQSRVLLAGIAIGQLFSAGLSILMVFYSDALRRIVYWTMGSLAGVALRHVLLCLFVLIAAYGVLHHYRREMNLLLLGDDAAKSMGVSTEKVKRILLFSASFLTAVLVSFTGVIGFVGLMIPHIARLSAGSDHRILLPLSALWGAVFLLVSDTIARTLASPLEIPIGVITALFGAPFFLWLLSRSEGGHL